MSISKSYCHKWICCPIISHHTIFHLWPTCFGTKIRTCRFHRSQLTLYRPADNSHKYLMKMASPPSPPIYWLTKDNTFPKIYQIGITYCVIPQIFFISCGLMNLLWWLLLRICIYVRYVPFNVNLNLYRVKLYAPCECPSASFLHLCVSQLWRCY